ncbi:MAG: response regulator [Candidatus Binatia bacterium]
MKTILLADDEVNLRMLARITLDDPDYRIIEAEDGLTALALARTERPDLLVLDWMMPGLSGIEVARELRRDPATSHVPIIMLTAKGQEADKAQGRAAGIHAHLVKPFSPLELLQKIQEIWKQQTTSANGQIARKQAEELQDFISTAQPLQTSSSQLALYVRDLRRTLDTERQRTQELAEANSRLQILDRLKNDFLAFISHELRTPLNTLSAVDILDPQAGPKEQGEIIEIIRRGYDRLSQFIEKGLEYFNWMAADKVDLTVTTDLATVVRQTITKMVTPSSPEVSLTSSGLDTVYPIQGNPHHWITVVETLFDNAIKFSQLQPIIRLSVQLYTLENQVILEIADNGEGFQPEMASELFLPFTIADALHHSRGTGLSLALARTITEAYGGKISAESQGLQQGATFIVTVPLS